MFQQSTFLTKPPATSLPQHFSKELKLLSLGRALVKMSDTLFFSVTCKRSGASVTDVKELHNIWMFCIILGTALVVA